MATEHTAPPGDEPAGHFPADTASPAGERPGRGASGAEASSPGKGPCQEEDGETAYETGLEVITRASAGLVDPADLIRVLRDMMVRVARVEIGGRPVGTGVLVAPDVLLTAGHVLGTAREPGILPEGLEARFDFVTPDGEGRVAPHERGMRAQLTEVLESSPPTAAERNASPLAWDASPRHLDYALLRVGRPMAYSPAFLPSGTGPRGHYLLEQDTYDFHHANLLFVVHHPLGEPTRVSHTTTPVVVNDEGTRIRYQNVNTTPGSSGGPIVDLRGRLVGIHHYAAGAVNQGIPARMIARAVARGPHARILNMSPPPPAGPPSGAAHAVMLSWVPQDRSWADLVHDVLAALGHQVLMGPSVDRPGHRTLREHVNGGGKVLALVSPAYLADPGMTDERDHIVHDFDYESAPSRLVPVLVEGEASGSLALLSPVDLREVPVASGTGHQEHDRMREASTRLASALGPSLSAPAVPSAPASRESVLGFRPGDPLPRLRLLSDRARKSAGTVSGTVFADGQESQFAAGLYVTRDLEEDLLNRLDTDALTPLVVVGEAGCGKTSILWSLARRRCGMDTGEVFFLKATWLVSGPSGDARVDPSTLVKAIEQARGDGRTVIVLIDTVDVLVNNEDDWEQLVTIVHAAGDAGAMVVMTSRVSEAAELPAEWRRLPLSDYATDTAAGRPHTTSEFERAVLAHSRFFTNDPQLREDLISRMLAIVARDISLHPLCLRPLTLRMLFEIYTPGLVPDVVDTTGLYETYWDHRVTCDRRSWDPGGNASDHDHDRDLGATAVALALEMLRTGRPEAWIDRVRRPADLTAARLRQETALLEKRGVGHFANGVFQFFHQTFFEYAASYALVHGRGAAGLGALIERLQEADGEDYFSLAVLEQAWLCADRTQDAADSAAATVGTLLKTISNDLDEERLTVRYGLRRAVLSVCAQSSLPTEEMLTDLRHILGSPRLALPALRQFLDLLPAPGRAYEPRDTDCLKAAANRTDNAWIAVLEVLDRLLPRDPGEVVGAVRTAGLVQRAIEGGHALSTRGEFADFLVRLLPAQPEETFPLVRSVVWAAFAADNYQYAADVLSRMAASSATHGEPHQWAGWADGLLGDTRVTSSALIKAHTSVQLPFLRTLTFPELVDRLTDLAPRLSVASGATTADRSLLGGLLTAVADVCPPDADPGPLIDLLVHVTRREQVADLSRGSLVRLIDSNSPVGRAVRDLSVDWLVQGMPIADRDDKEIVHIRAKVARTALEQLDLPAHRVADVAGRAAAAWEAPNGDAVQVWRSTGCLLPLLVRGAVAGVPEAAAALDELPGGFAVTGPDVTAWSEPYNRWPADAAEAGMMVDLLVRIGELRQAKTMLVNGVALDDASLTRLTHSALGTLRAAVPSVRPSGMNHELRTKLKALAELLVALRRRGTKLDLPWTELAGWIDRVTDPLARGWLVELVGVGLEQREYPPADALRLLRAQCGADDTLDGESELGRKARLWCVWWYSVHGTASDIPEALRLAFHEPVDPHTVIKVSNFAFLDRRDAPLTEDERTGLLLDVGCRLRTSSLGAGRRKDIAKAWQAAMWTLVPDSTPDTQLRIIRHLPLLEDPFAAHLLHCVPVNRTPELRAALSDVAARPDLGARLQRAVHQIQDLHKRHSSEGGWPSLFVDLARAGA